MLANQCSLRPFVAKLAVETLDKCVFDRFAGADEPQLDAASVGPRVERAAAEFGAVIHHQDLGQPDRLGEPVEYADDAQAGKRAVDFDRDTFPRNVGSLG